MILKKLFNRDWILHTLVILAFSLVCIRLGIWQLDRLSQRRAFIHHFDDMRSLPVLEFSAGLDLGAQEFRLVRARGTYDHEHQVALRNQVHNGQYGLHMITPLRLNYTAHATAQETAVMVDRGWIPAEGNTNPSDWHKYDVPGEILVNGLIRLDQASPVITRQSNLPDTPDRKKIDFWLFVDIQQLQRQLPYSLLPVYIQLSPTSSSINPPIPSEPILDLTEGPHLGYAIQWFCFSALMILGYPVYVQVQERRQV